MNKIIEKIKNDEILQKIIPFLKGTNAYLIGGYIRDILLDKVSFDRDIVLFCDDIENLVKKISIELQATFVELDKDWGIYRLVLSDKKNYIDFAKVVDNDIDKDINRRDITINSIAYNLELNEIYDPNNALEDFKNKKIRAISEQNFIDDPLRLLRVFRFAAVTGFEIEEKTYDMMCNHVGLIEQPAKERINIELIKLFEAKYCAIALKLLDKIGMLEILFPFVREIKMIPPNSHHHLDLFNHSVETVRQIEENLFKLPEKAQENINQFSFGQVKRIAYLKLAAFMHDIGKPKTWSIDEKSNRHRFIKHDSVGAEMTPLVLKPLKFSKKQIAYIQNLIRNHIYPSNVNINNEKSVMKFFRKMEIYTPDIILLAMSDRLSAKGPDITEDIINNNIEHLNNLLIRYFERLEDLKPLPKLLSGNEIMQILNIEPSPKLGKIILALKTAQEEGEINTKEDAINFVKTYI